MTADQMLFTEKDLEKSMDKIETVHFHEVKSIKLLKYIKVSETFSDCKIYLNTSFGLPVCSLRQVKLY